MGKRSSPLRYPGGKARLYPYISTLICQYFDKKPVYAEAFAGGFGAGIELLLNNKVDRVLINDADICIYSFWKCVVSKHYHNRFVERIKTTPIDIQSWKKQRALLKESGRLNTLDIGFATFFLNRCNRSGILSANPIGGINQNGNYRLDCRFNKDRLIELIEIIYERRSQIEVFNLDAHHFIKEMDRSIENIFFMFDPPYVGAGPLLYKSNYDALKHQELSSLVQTLHNKWIMTYDDNKLVRNIYRTNTIRKYWIPYSLATKRTAGELIIYDHRLLNPPKLKL